MRLEEISMKQKTEKNLFTLGTKKTEKILHE